MRHGQVVGQNCRGKPWIVWNNVVLTDVHELELNNHTHRQIVRSQQAPAEHRTLQGPACQQLPGICLPAWAGTNALW
jgi:hypothetical protein